MDKNQILEILEDWNFWEKELEFGIERENYLVQAQKFLKSNIILSIVGARRSGKSYLMKQLVKQLMKRGIKKENLLIINFEDNRFTELNVELLDKIYETYLEILKPIGNHYIFLDEIDKVPNWEKWVRTFHELNKAKIIVSGSSSKLMSGELATLLTGRHLDITIFPLNFREFLYFKELEIKNKLEIVSKRIKIKSFFNEYLEYGGFPEIVLGQEKRRLLLTYFDDIITRDIEKRYNVRESQKLRNLANFFLTNISNLITFNSLKKYLELSTDTIEKFSSYLEEANMVFFIKRFSYKVKEQEKSPRKVYCIDLGLARAVGFRFSENLGFGFENLVALELRRRQKLNPLLEIYYQMYSSKGEVDFVVKKGQKVKELIQVCCNLENIRTKEREIKSLIKAMEEFKLKEGLVITQDKEGSEKIKGKTIKYIPLWKWLLEDD